LQTRAGEGLTAKKTGLISQGMTEKPGEFSNWYNSRIMQASGSSLYPTRTEIHWAIKEQFQPFLARNSNATVDSKPRNARSVKRKNKVLAAFILDDKPGLVPGKSAAARQGRYLAPQG
jgi:hypothetical protein